MLKKIERNFNNLQLHEIKTDVEGLKQQIRVGEVFHATILKRYNKKKFLIKIKNKKVTAESETDFQSNDIFVQVIQKEPRLHLKMVPIISGDSAQEIINFSIRYSTIFSLFEQSILSILLKNKKKFEKEKFHKFATFIKKMFILFDNRFIGDIEDFIDYYDNDSLISENLLNNDAFLEKEIKISPKLYFSSIDCHQIRFNCFKRIDKNLLKYQFIVRNEIYGKFNIVATIIEDEIKLDVIIDNSFKMKMVEENLPLIKSLLKELQLELLAVNYIMISQIQINDEISGTI